MENKSNKDLSKNNGYSMESIVESQLRYLSDETLKSIAFDCVQRCGVQYEDDVLNGKDTQCVKNCSLTYYENFFSEKLN